MHEASMEMHYLTMTSKPIPLAAGTVKPLSPKPPKMADEWSRYGSNRMVKILQAQVKELTKKNASLHLQLESVKKSQERAEEVEQEKRQKLRDEMAACSKEWDEAVQLLKGEHKKEKKHTQKRHKNAEEKVASQSRQI